MQKQQRSHKSGSRPEFRNPDKFQLLPFREWIRRNLPSGSDGFVCEDLDLVVRVFGEWFGQDSIGRFMLIELKFMGTRLGRAQRMTFGLVDRLLRAGDPDAKRYRGYFVLEYSDEDWDLAEFRVNGVGVTQEELFGFLLFMPNPKIEPFVFHEVSL